MTKIGVGVLGVGTMGRCHAENLRRACPRAKLVAVADPNQELARRVAEELEIENSYEDASPLLERGDVQAVVIASPAKFHAAAIQTAAAAGKDILCEKPLALTLKEADAALDSVAKAGVRLQVGHMRRYDPAYAEARRQIEAGDIGDPILFKAIGRDPELPPPSYFQSGLNGMLFLDSSIHDFDLARWLMGDEIAEVHAYGSALVRPELTEFNDIDSGVVNLRFSRGAIGNVESFRQARYGYDIRTEIIGTKDTLLVGSLRNTTSQLALTSASAAHDIVDHYLKRFSEAYRREMLDFIDILLDDREPTITGKDGRQALAVALAAQRSFQEAQPVSLI